MLILVLGLISYQILLMQADGKQNPPTTSMQFPQSQLKFKFFYQRKLVYTNSRDGNLLNARKTIIKFHCFDLRASSHRFICPCTVALIIFFNNYGRLLFELRRYQ